MSGNPSSFVPPTLGAYNATPPTDDGAQTEANRITWAKIKTKLTDVLKTYTEDLSAAVAAVLTSIYLFLGQIGTKSADFSITAADDGKLFLVSGNTTGTLPSAVTVGANFRIGFKKTDSSATTTTIARVNAETIDGATSRTITVQYQVVWLVSDGSNWHVAVGHTAISTIAGLSDVAAQTVSQVPNADNAIDLGSSGPKGWRRLYVGDGAVGTPAVTFSGDIDNGLYRIGTNNWALAVAGAKALELDPSGTILRPLQTAFIATSGSQTDFTGDATDATMTWTEVVDQNADFASNTYTAPVGTLVPTLFTVLVSLQQIGVGHTALSMTLVTSNRTLFIAFCNPANGANGTSFNPRGAVITDMDSGDTAVVKIAVSGSTKTVDTNTSGLFSGYLL